MAATDVKAALEAMGDPEVRARIISGDMSDLGGLSLNEPESELVKGAAADYPEVEGFQFSLGMIEPVDPTRPFGQAVIYADPGHDVSRRGRRRGV
jgi:hypothetical protein